MKLPPLGKVLVVANIIWVVVLALIGVDWYVRWRVSQGITSYHNVQIVPLITPRPAPPPAK